MELTGTPVVEQDSMGIEAEAGFSSASVYVVPPVLLPHIWPNLQKPLYAMLSLDPELTTELQLYEELAYNRKQLWATQDHQVWLITAVEPSFLLIWGMMTRSEEAFWKWYDPLLAMMVGYATALDRSSIRAHARAGLVKKLFERGWIERNRVVEYKV